MPPIPPAYLSSPVTSRIQSPGSGNAQMTSALRAQGMSPIGIGCARIGSLSSAHSVDHARAMLALAAANGITLLDTAGIYGGGTSEQVVGHHARGNAGVFVMTKIGRHQTAFGRLAHSIKRWTRPMIGARTRSLAGTLRQGAIQTNFSPLALELAAHAAQQRLGQARMHALLLHSPPAEELAQPATLQALESFKLRGKADWVGVSCDELDSLRIATDARCIDIVQMPLPLYHLAARAGLVERLIGSNVAIVLRGVLRDRGERPVRDALAAAAALPGVSSVLVGVSSPAHLQELL